MVKLEISASQLSLAARGDDVSRLHSALNSLDRRAPDSETESRVYGQGTLSIVKAIQQELDIPTTGALDDQTIEAINALLKKRATLKRTVRGLVIDGEGNPVSDAIIVVTSSNKGAPVLGRAELSKGAFTIDYQPPNSAERVDIRVTVSREGKELETIPSGDTLLIGANRLEVINFVLAGPNVKSRSEYEQILDTVKPLLGRRRLAGFFDEKDDERILAELALRAGLSPDRVAMLARSHFLARETKLPSELFYALLRQNLPPELDSIHAVEHETRIAALKNSIDSNFVPSQIDGETLSAALQKLIPNPPADLRRLLDTKLSTSDRKLFLSKYVENDKSVDAFWENLGQDPQFGNITEELKLTVQLSGLTNNFLPLVKAIQERGDIKAAPDLVRLTNRDWVELVATSGVPENTPGETKDKKHKAYVDIIISQIEAAFPTRIIADRLGATSSGNFLKSNPNLDLQRTYLGKWIKQAPATLGQQDRNRLETVVRLQRLTDNSAETIALERAGFKSAASIANSARRAFIDGGSGLPPDRAKTIHNRARRVQSTALALFSENATAMNKTSLQALPAIDAVKQVNEANAEIPDWATLFGVQDACACEHCRSAHSPAAYFVDLLEFLEKRDALGPLLDRRQDLGEIELSCDNTHIPLPTIDLINEIMEATVAPAIPFQGFGLNANQVAALEGSGVSPILANAFLPPLQNGATITELKKDKLWRIFDTSYAFDIRAQNGVHEVIARSRQTTGSRSVRRATPQYRNDLAYDELANAVHPLSMPFDLASIESTKYLQHLGVKKTDFLNAFSAKPTLFDTLRADLSVNADVDAEALKIAMIKLGVNDLDRDILTSNVFSPPLSLEALWGEGPIADLSSVRVLLDRARVSYAKLVELINTWFVDPAKDLSIRAIANEPVDTCNTSKLEVHGLTTGHLNRLLRFIRLEKKLKLPVSELDNVLFQLKPDGALSPVIDDDLLIKLSHLLFVSDHLSISAGDAVVLWSNLKTDGLNSPYEKLFFDPTLGQIENDVFRIDPVTKNLIGNGDNLEDHAPVLQAVLRLNSSDLTRLAERTDGLISLATVSQLLRHALLARQLRLSPNDLIALIEISGLDPLNVDRFQECIWFCELVEMLKGGGIRISELAYWVTYTSSPDSAMAPTHTELQNQVSSLWENSQTTAENVQSLPDWLASELQITADIAGTLLDRVSHQGVDARTHLLEITARPGVGLPVTTPTLTLTNAAAAFETLAHLHRLASIISKLQLEFVEVDWLFREADWLLITAAPAPVAALYNWFPLVQYLSLKSEIDDAALRAVITGLNGIAAATDNVTREDAKAELINALVTLVKWPEQDIIKLIGTANTLADAGEFSVNIPKGASIVLIDRLARAMRLLKRLGTNAERALLLIGQESMENTSAIRKLAKSKHDSEEWLKVVEPIQNLLRDEQRAALVDYLVARPALWGGGNEDRDVNALLNRLLIDVEITSCQTTSRIRQAISTVQTYVQRCLLGLEPQINVDDPEWNQWEWMKNYRVWDVNRKIWLYPENWIEPELRDDKSPFFDELENELLQGELTDELAESAFRKYIEAVDEVSRLEIVATHQDTETMDVHVVGRTFHTPRRYFYRKKAGSTGLWTAWENIDIDIEGDHLIPTVWNRQFMLIWPIFTEKSYKKNATMPATNKPLLPADKYWEIKLAWSEKKSTGWSGKYLTEPVEMQAYQGEDNVRFGPFRESNEPKFNAGKIVLSMMMANTNGNNNGIPPVVVDPGDPLLPDDEAAPPPTVSKIERVLAPKRLFYFKPLLRGSRLIIRGYLRRDYRQSPEGGDQGIACAFGEFRFLGCRKTVTTDHRAMFNDSSFPLAPLRQSFDHQWFAGQTNRFNMIDSNLVEGGLLMPVAAVGAAFDLGNEGGPIAGDPIKKVASRIDIPVLKRAGKHFRLMPDHQDLQFDGDRPFFYMDSKRIFVVTSTGGSRKIDWGMHHNWVKAELESVWKADYFPSPPPPKPQQPPQGGLDTSKLNTLSFLTLDADGRRTITTKSAPKLTIEAKAGSALQGYWTSRKYSFGNFHHPYTCDFEKTLNKDGVSALFVPTVQELADDQSFSKYQPIDKVIGSGAIDDVEFQHDTAYAIYNWELFFHIPLLIADHLRQNQRFEDSQRWFHYIFNPTSVSDADVPQKYWQTKPFRQRASADYENHSVKAIEKIIAEGTSTEWDAAVADWRDNPFSPHAVARLRSTAYQKSVVMKYIDMLIEWGDQQFARETLESINEASQLYVLAAEILGDRPEKVEREDFSPMRTYNTLSHVGALSNSLEAIELLIAATGTEDLPVSDIETPDLPAPTTLLFCLPQNENLVAYWDKVADRLFKLRHCQNLKGRNIQPPLFEAAIDPALLVRARAAGISIADVVSGLNTPSPVYRFQYVLQKAQGFTNDVRSFGAALLSAYEKRDAEALATLRSDHEIRLLKSVKDVRKQQIEEAKSGLKGLQASRATVEARRTFYEERERLSGGELSALTLSGDSLKQQNRKAFYDKISSIGYAIPNFKAGSPTTAGLTIGGVSIGAVASAGAQRYGAKSARSQGESSLVGRRAELARRTEDWDQQLDQATRELKQIDEQIIGSEIRLAIAENELRNHEIQREQAAEIGDYLQSKYTNTELYQWMIGQVSTLYFQAYQLAINVAKQAEKCFGQEVDLDGKTPNYVSFGKWDSLREGLIAGDHLAHDLNRLDAAYLDMYTREFELTKHISLRQLDPLALLKLRAEGNCEIDIPEWVFDMDNPGHYRRRIKMVNLSIPSVGGPYTSVTCKLTLQSNEFRQVADRAQPVKSDFLPSTESIVTSHGIQDAGMFEPNLRDERYLPFEGAGAVGKWKLELPSPIPSFDRETVSDLIMQVRYTAKDGGGAAEAAAKTALEDVFGAAATIEHGLMLSLKHDFPTEWAKYVSGTEPFEATIDKSYLPYFSASRDLMLKGVKLIKSDDPILEADVAGAQITGNLSGPQGLKFKIDENDVAGISLTRDPAEECFVVVQYEVKELSTE